MVTFFLRSKRAPFDSQITALETTTKKGDFIAATVEKLCYLFTRVINRLHRMSAKGIDTASIPIFRRQIGQHSIKHTRVQRGGSSMIKIDGMLWHLFPPG